MQMKSDNTRILMSEQLKNQLGDDIDVDGLSDTFVIAVMKRSCSGVDVPITGIVHGVLFDLKPELEFRVQITDALDVVEADKQVVNGVEVHYGERVVEMRGPFAIAAARIMDVDPKTQMCTLMVQLTRK